MARMHLENTEWDERATDGEKRKGDGYQLKNIDMMLAKNDKRGNFC
jgi:hypothetical protein